MNDPTSRYPADDPLDPMRGIKQRTLADGRVISHRERRFLPRGEDLPVLAEIPRLPGERLDGFAARVLGHAGLYWRICDANNAMSPADLFAEVEARGDSRVRIAMPRPPGT